MKVNLKPSAKFTTCSGKSSAYIAGGERFGHWLVFAKLSVRSGCHLEVFPFLHGTMDSVSRHHGNHRNVACNGVWSCAFSVISKCLDYQQPGVVSSVTTDVPLQHSFASLSQARARVCWPPSLSRPLPQKKRSPGPTARRGHVSRPLAAIDQAFSARPGYRRRAAVGPAPPWENPHGQRQQV